MPRRQKSETVQTGLRMKEELRARLDEAARERGASLNGEVISRLERSLQQDTAFGSPRLTQYAYLMASSFALSGQRSAGVPNDSWLDNNAAFLSAVTGVFDALLRDRPLDDARLVLQALIGRHATREAIEREQAK